MSNRPHLRPGAGTVPQPAPQLLPVPLIANALGLTVQRVSPTQAGIILHNPIIQAQALATRAELEQLADRLRDVAAELDDTPAPSALVVPEGAGRIVPVRD